MKKDLIFAPLMLVVGVLLFLLKETGLTAHIAISILGILILAAYTAVCKKDWKIPALEIFMRACYGIALITGIVIMNVAGVAAVTTVHKVSALLFVVLLVVLLVHKLALGKSEKK